MTDKRHDSSDASLELDSRLRSSKFAANRWKFVAVALILLVVGTLIFSDFVFGAKVLLYKDYGGDSVNDTYPTLIHLSDYLHAHGLPSWSFSVGMGQSIYYLMGSVFLEPVVWLHRNLIPSSLIYLHLLKALIAGMLFWGFLRLRRVCFAASVAGALGLSFSAHMCMGACWIMSADDTVCFTAVLFAAEFAIVSGYWILIPIAVALSGMTTVFHLYLSALLLSFYVPARHIECYGWQPRVTLGVSCRLAIVALLGIGFGAVVFFGSAYAVLNSTRGSPTVGDFPLGPRPSLLQFGTSLFYITTALRQFSADLVGTGDAYRGWENYYEASLGYCTLLPILLVPQIFVSATRRQRMFYSSLLCLITLPIVFPWFRCLFWLFRGAYFRTFSLFTIFILLALSATALSRYARRGALGVWTLALTLFALLVWIHLPIPQIQEIINHDLKWPVTLFLVAYALLLVTGQAIKRQNFATLGVVMVAVIELVWFDRITVNRPTVLKPELSQRVGYNDLTVDAVRDIKASDTSFFRVTKTWGSGPASHPSFNDALVFGYYSTPSYSSFNSLNYINFLVSVGAITLEKDAKAAQWSLGLMWQPLLLAFACEKYAITTQPDLFERVEQYDFIKKYENIYAYEDKAFLPLGLVFYQYIPTNLFLPMPDEVKAQSLLRVAVMDEADLPNNQLHRLSLDKLDSEIREVPLNEVLLKRRSAVLQIDSFDETRITGNVHLESSGVLVLQMPFDRGWHAFANEKPAPVIKVDSGLTGVMLQPGQHKIELRYRQPFLVSGAFVSLISLLVFVVAATKWPRIPQS